MLNFKSSAGSFRSLLIVMNPLFWWRKRQSFINRIFELPSSFLWLVAYEMYERGFVDNAALDVTRAFYNAHAGESAILVGNGPSVDIDTLNTLYKSEYVTFGFNKIHLAYPHMDFRPRYVVSSDEQMIADHGEEIAQCNPHRTFFIAKKNHKIKSAYWFFMKKSRAFKFSRDPQSGMGANGGSLIPAIQIAYYMGIRKFYLYGVDHSFKFQRVKGENRYGNAMGEGNHFIENYRGGDVWQAPTPELIERALIICDQELRKEGGFVKNATAGGKLELLERVSLKDVLSGADIET